MTDKQQFTVERILQHKGDANHRTAMQLLVKWAGYDDPTWEPWANVRTNVHLHRYLNVKGLKKLIPKNYIDPANQAH